MLGFKTLTTVDLQTGVRTRTRYRQDFPYIGLPLTTYGATSTWEKEFGRLTQSVVTRQRDEADDGACETSGRRSASFTYYTSGHRKGLLHTEVRDAVRDGRTVLIPAHTTIYDYDRFGNRVRAKVQAASGAASSALATRCDHDTTEYDSYGRFVVQERDCANRVVRRMSTYNHYGLPAWSEQVINDLPRRAVRTTYSYTAGGRQYFSRTADGSWTGTVWRACGGAVSCPQAGYHVETRHAGGGRERVYRDVLGRTMRTRARGFDGAWVLTDTEYDRLGRVKRRSEPFYAGGDTPRRWSGYTRMTCWAGWCVPSCPITWPTA